METPRARPNFLQDRLFWAALVVALPFWALFLWIQPRPYQFSQIQAHWNAALMIVLVYPVLEEIVFRGALQGFLLRKLPYRLPGPFSLANIITSIVFALMHGIVWATAWSLLVVLPSLVYGYFRDRSGGITASMLLHAFYNAGFFLVTLPVGR